MDGKKRNVVMAGNWKMNKNLEETKNFFDNLNSLIETINCEVIFAVPYTDLDLAVKETENSKIKIAAQNCHFETSGAYTGEISANMLKEKKVFGVILGHSERRIYFNETDKTVNLKIKAALKAGLVPIVCVGETLDQREDNITGEIISMQIKRALLKISSNDVRNIIIAYEPVWAIGTGKTASNEQASAVCSHIRSILENIYSKDIAQDIPILYGGSMNPKNCEGLLLQEDIDGGLIGGASLKAKDFFNMIKIANSFL